VHVSLPLQLPLPQPPPASATCGASIAGATVASATSARSRTTRPTNEELRRTDCDIEPPRAIENLAVRTRRRTTDTLA
jgi:hypothetical protein